MGGTASCPWSDSSCAFHDVMAVLCYVCIVSGALLLWRFYSHPVVAPRFPDLIGWEVLLGMLKVACIAAIYGNFYPVWEPFPCLIGSAVYDGIDIPMRLASTARLCMLTLQMASNGLFKFPSKHLKNYVWVLSVLTAPAAHNSLVKRLNEVPVTSSREIKAVADHATAVATEEPSTVQAVAVVVPAHSSADSSKNSFNLNLIDWFFSDSVGNFGGKRRFSFLMILWWIFGGLLMNIVSFAVVGSKETLAPNSLCFLPQLYVLAAWQIFWAILHVPFLFIFAANSDAIGLRNENLASLVIEIVSCFVGSYALITHSGRNLANRIFDLGSLFMPPFLALSVMTYYVYRFEHGSMPRLKGQKRREDSRTSGASSAASNKEIRTAAEFEAFWREGGAEVMTELAKARYLIENVMYIDETDKASEGISFEKFQALFKKYIEDHSPFQLNVKNDLIEKWSGAIRRGEVDLTAVTDVRRETMRILMTNLGSKIFTD